MMTRRSLLKSAVAAASLVLGASAQLVCAEPAQRPNVLFLFSDDQQHDTIHALGNDAIETPNLDRLVSTGTTFTNAYIMGGSSPAVCSPSRAALLTGRTLWNVENQGEYGFEMSEKHKTLPEVFRAAGYDTFATGKNEPGRSGQFGRAYSAGGSILFKGMSNQYRIGLYNFSPTGEYPGRADAAVSGKHSSEVYADEAIRFLEQRDESAKPFFAYVAFQAPHDPRQAPPEYEAIYQKKQPPLPAAFMPAHPFDNGMLKIRDEKTAPFPRTEEVIQKQFGVYYAMITHMDAQIGRIIDTLKQKGQFDNTIIVFSSDNGLALGRHGLMGKQNVYEHSVRVPMIVAGPGVAKAQQRSQVCYLYDIYPTLCDLAGLKTPETVEFKSLTPVLKSPDAAHRDHLYFAFMSWQRAVREGQYKLIEYCVNGQRQTQLFDLSNDPDELTNLAGRPESADVLQRLRKLLQAERVRLNDGNTPYPFTDGQGKSFWQTYESTEQTQFP